MQSIREKIALRGFEALSDTELLSILLEDKALADTLIKECGTLVSLANLPASRLRMIAGLGARLTERIKVATEIGYRCSAGNNTIEESISSSEDVVNIMHPRLKDLKHEECWAIYLTNSNRVIECSRISQGGVQATVVDHRIIVKRALELLSTRIIIVHNHPSGSATPSSADITLTKKIKEATALFDIQLLDHIIICDSTSYSFKSSNNL